MNSHLTAIARKSLPAPTRWLIKNGMLRGRVLDYGCGRCKPLNDKFIGELPTIGSITSYDPHFEPNPLVSNSLVLYTTIICNYVLCTLPEQEENPILKHIRGLLTDNGIAYITVRNDVPKNGYGISSRGTFQRKVRLYLPLLSVQRDFRIYLLTSHSKLYKM